MKKTIHLKESQLKRMIQESVRKTLYESQEEQINYFANIIEEVLDDLPFYDMYCYEGQMVEDNTNETNWVYRFKTSVGNIEQFENFIDALDNCDEITISNLTRPRKEEGYEGLTFMTEIYSNEY